MTTLAKPTSDRPQPLRQLLLADAAVCVASGAALAAAAGPIAGLTGISANSALPVGMFLLAWGAWIGYAGTRPTLSRRAAWIVVTVNFVWVLASLAVLFGGLMPLTQAGWWFVAAQALAVDLLAVMQWLALRRSR